LKVSIITVCFNSEKTIEDTIKSVINQTYNNIEYIIIDGGSNDKTIDIINKYSDKIYKFISEKDNGIYDAINKGINLSTGYIVGILNSDDYFFDNSIISNIVDIFTINNTVDSVIGDINFVNTNNKLIREYKSLNWKPSLFKFGIMPPHPTFYCKRILYDKFGLYNNRYKIAGDFDLLIRFLFVNKISYHYFPKSMVTMRLGGISTSGIKSIITINKEILHSCLSNNIQTNYIYIYLKYFKKLFEFKFF
jgi:glycosyltransferase involved in cell wall biosynthesis